MAERTEDDLRTRAEEAAPWLLDRLDHAEATLARLEAAIRLVSPDHITPQGARIIRAALTEQRREQCYKATADRDRAEAALARVRELVADTGNTSTGPTYALCADVLAAIEGIDS